MEYPQHGIELCNFLLMWTYFHVEIGFLVETFNFKEMRCVCANFAWRVLAFIPKRNQKPAVAAVAGGGRARGRAISRQADTKLVKSKY